MGELLGTVPDMDESDTRSAIEVAYKAYQSWREVPAKVRGCQRMFAVCKNPDSITEMGLLFLMQTSS